MPLDFEDGRGGLNDRAAEAAAADEQSDGTIAAPVASIPHVDFDVRPLALRRISPTWTDFAAAHGGSWRSDFGQVHLLRLRHWFKGRLIAFEVFANDAQGQRSKVAQCLVSVRGNQLTFTDGLQVATDFEPHRSAILMKILPHLPAGRVSYGWTWSLVDVPVEDFRRVPGTSGHASREVVVHSVDLANWSCWESYYKSISNNVRRNVKRAEQAEAPVVVVAGKGLNAIGLIPDLVRMRLQTLERVEMVHPAWRMALSYLANVILMPRSCCIAIARHDGKPLAGLFGYEFGSDFYYWQGGSVDASNGAAWKLLTDTIGHWYRKHPDGQFIMGYCDDSLPGNRREGLHRQRESLRKSDFPTRIVTFDWAPEKA